jgi:hypothetical protein
VRNRRERIRRMFVEVSRLTNRQAHRLTMFQEILMAGQQELNDKIAELNRAVEADEEADQQLVDQLEAQIADLKAQVAAGTPIDTQAQIDALEAIKEKLVASNTGGGDTSGTPVQ